MRNVILCWVMIWGTVGCQLPTVRPQPRLSDSSATPTTLLGTTVVPTPTLEPLAASSIATITAQQSPQIDNAYASPNQQWRASVLLYPCMSVGEAQQAYEVLQIEQIGQAKVRQIDQQLRNCQGLGGFGLGGLLWSANSRYFYYTNAREGGPDGCALWGRPIFRLDTQNMQVQPLGNGAQSPTEEWLLTWQGDQIKVWNANDGSTQGISLLVPTDPLVAIAWSPTGQSFVYLQTVSACPPTGPSHAVRVDLPGLQQQVLFTNQGTVFHGLYWEELERIHLFDEALQVWQFDLETKHLMLTRPPIVLPLGWDLHQLPEFEIALAFPVGWQSSYIDGFPAYSGQDGFAYWSFVGSVSSQESICSSVVIQAKETGHAAEVEHFTVDGQPACLVRQASRAFNPTEQSLLAVAYPNEHRFLMIASDPQHIDRISKTVRFLSKPR